MRGLGSMPEPLFLGIDAGGSKTHAVLLSAEGKLLGRGEGGAANVRTTPRDKVRRALSAAIAEAAGGVSELRLRAVGIGSAGVPERAGEAEARVLLEGLVEAETVLLDSDAFAAWAGAFALGPGVLLASGTGSVCFGGSLQGTRVLVGGWGWRFGDEGSAYGIAAEGIRLALHAADGRAQAPELWQALLAFVGLPAGTPEARRHSVEAWLYDPARTPGEIARFAPRVAALAEADCHVARGVLVRAGEELAHMVQAARAAAELTGTVQVALTGSVLTHNQSLRQAVTQALSVVPEHYQLCDPRHPADVGAALAAMQASGHDVTL